MIDILKEIKKDISNLELKAYMKKNNHIFSLIDDFIIKYNLSSKLIENKRNIVDDNILILGKKLKKVVNVVDCYHLENDAVVIKIRNEKIREGRFNSFDKDTLPQIKVTLKENNQKNTMSNLKVEYNVFSSNIEMSNSETRFRFEGENIYGGFISYTNHKYISFDGLLGITNTFNYPKNDNRKNIKVNLTINYESEKIYIKDIITPFTIVYRSEVLEFNDFLNSNFNEFSRYLENKENKKCLNDAVELLKLVSDTDNRIIKEFLKSNDYSGIRLFDNDYLSFKKSKLGLFYKLFKK